MWKSRFNLSLPKRAKDSHKGSFGRLLIVAGSSGMSGSAILASRAAMRSGVGLTYLAVPQKLVDFIDLASPEVITLSFEKIKTIKPNTLVVGPGLGLTPKTRQLLFSLLTTHYAQLTTILLDADALNIVAKRIGLLRKAQAKAKVIITPHPGEMARLIKKKIAYVQSNRRKVAKEFARSHNCVVVLKGHRTLVADPCGDVYENKTGNPGMATAGVGDVLSGMIGALSAQGLSSFDAAMIGVYTHGQAGDMAAREKGECGLIASDIVEKIPYAIRKIC